jgi:proteic killer suppression protein
VIGSFACKHTEALFRTGKSRRFGNIAKAALRRLDYLDAAGALSDLRSPPGNHLEVLGGDRAGQHSIRINDQWRICFVWRDGRPDQVQIVDYH